MATVNDLVLDVLHERNEFLSLIQGVSEAQSKWKPDEVSWSITDITEHLFWAEQGSIAVMWKVLLASRKGEISWEGDEPHKGLEVEAIIEKTWKPKEEVPPIAAPRFGGPIIFWTQSLFGLQQVLELFGKDLKDEELEMRAHPHPISGPLNFKQRLQFLRYHIQRHRGQVLGVIANLPSEM